MRPGQRNPPLSAVPCSTASWKECQRKIPPFVDAFSISREILVCIEQLQRAHVLENHSS